MEDQKVKNFISKVYKFKEVADKLIHIDIKAGREITLEILPEYEEVSKGLEESIKELEGEIE